MKKYILLFIVLVAFFTTNVWAESFVVRKINIQGLQRVSEETVNTYLPVHVGQVISPETTGHIITSLYKTGFFEHIALAREGDTLVIKVIERPTIGQLKISGNSSIPTDKLTTVMKSVNIAEGRVYNDVMLERIKQSLLNQYYALGRYNARVDVSVTPMGRNRVLIKIDISEGLIAKVQRINIIGNHAFSEKVLTKQLELTKPGLLTFYTQTDRFTQEKLDESLEKLRNFYLDRGYIKFVIKSSQVAISPDRKSIFLTIVVDEGMPYTVKGYTLVGNTIIPREQLIQRITVKPGSPFSRKDVIGSEKAISHALGDRGYMYSVVSLKPQIDESTREVFLTFDVTPGKRVYIRHINFIDNTKTNDVVLRREITQMEAAPVSTSKLDESKHRLSMLPYIKNVDMSVDPVPNTNDRADVNYKVTEQNSAEASVSIGYSQLDHLILGAGLNQKNFLGTGKTLGFNAQHSRYQNLFGINYTDPYYTPDGISRSINISLSKTQPRGGNLTGSYNSNQYAASVIYGIPLGQEKDVINTLQLGFGYEQTLIKLANSGVSNQVQSFVSQHGRHFHQLNLILGVSRDSRDKAIFPTQGMIQTLSGNLFLPVASRSLRYYMLGYNAHWYHPIVGNFIATARGDLGYGNAFNGAVNYPFFKNFYAGGMDSVRGYEGNTLGPLDSTGLPTGGNALIDASAGIIFPNPISENLRTTWFVDGGNVYNTFDNKQFGGKGSGPIRYSTGIEADWLTPLGVLIDLSYARPINPKPNDSREYFQFTLGANFG